MIDLNETFLRTFSATSTIWTTESGSLKVDILNPDPDNLTNTHALLSISEMSVDHHRSQSEDVPYDLE